jgi:hypothetical protein
MDQVLHHLTCPHCWAMALASLPFISSMWRRLKR